MKKLPVLSARDLIKALQKDDFIIVGQKGSHIRLKKKTPSETRIVIVPNHDEIAKGTLISILRQAGWSRERMFEMLE
jgi:predicted RNA binding protein YcfA (HicA-like mRNA interferase family)